MQEIMNDDSLSMKLKTLRVKNKLTQSQVASTLNISQQTYSKYENKGINIDNITLKNICLLFNVSADYLLGIEKSKKPETSVSYQLHNIDFKELVEKVAVELSKNK